MEANKLKILLVSKNDQDVFLGLSVIKGNVEILNNELLETINEYCPMWIIEDVFGEAPLDIETTNDFQLYLKGQFKSKL